MASLSDPFGVQQLLRLDDPGRIGRLRQFVHFFPEHGLSQVLTGYSSSQLVQSPLRNAFEEGQAQRESDAALKLRAPLPEAECLALITQGVEAFGSSRLAHCLLGEYYLFLEDYENAAKIARQGLKIAAAETQRTELDVRKTHQTLSTVLATALIYYQAPKNHPEAKEAFRAVLHHVPTFTPALAGMGLILQEEEHFDEAIDFFLQATTHDPSNGRTGAELAWCYALKGDYAAALGRLEEYLDCPQMEASTQRGQHLRAQTLYRIGVCLWKMNPSPRARKDRNGAYARFLASVRVSPTFAPAYAALGLFYEDYRGDHKRARQCFQKALELSQSELVAAERLARSFANQGEWDIVEVIAQRVIDSGQVRPLPGSKTKGVSWPYSALGVVSLNNQEFDRSIVSFLAALRLRPDDYHSYVGLGESYHNSGRYNSAARTLNYAENPPEGMALRDQGDSWFTTYILANVKRELGEYANAVEAYEQVLIERPKELGVSLTLLQTLVQKSSHCVDTGFFGEAADTAIKAVDVAAEIAARDSGIFGVWKALGDALSVFTIVQGRMADAPLSKVKEILAIDIDVESYDVHAKIDGVKSNALAPESAQEKLVPLKAILKLSILSHKRAIISCMNDKHAQAVAWYNLGWAEHRAHICLEKSTSSGKGKKSRKFLRAAFQCFKQAIELESGNAEFWNSLGVATMKLNPKVSQHALARSLNLDQRSSHVWTNLGTLCLLQHDLELAHMAFSRAQSTDPNYAQAWLGEGIVALLSGDPHEALVHFTHAFELSDSSCLLAKRQYAARAFDQLLSLYPPSSDDMHVLQPLFALQQLVVQQPSDVPSQHLRTLFLERLGSHDAAILALKLVCDVAEQDFKATQSPTSRSCLIQARSDLARNCLAIHDYEAAARDAVVVLDLLSGDDSKLAMSSGAHYKAHQSASLTAGLALSSLDQVARASIHFRAALKASSSWPDLVCTVAEALWAKGGADEKDLAQQELFASVEECAEHVDAVMLIGAIAAIDEDADAMDAVRDDLGALRTKPGLDARQLARAEQVLEAIVAVTGDAAQVTAEAQCCVMLTPWKSMGWARLADVTAEPFAADMALATAKGSIPPGGDTRAEAFARALQRTGRREDALRAVFVAPWTDMQREIVD